MCLPACYALFALASRSCRSRLVFVCTCASDLHRSQTMLPSAHPLSLLVPIVPSVTRTSFYSVACSALKLNCCFHRQLPTDLKDPISPLLVDYSSVKKELISPLKLPERRSPPDFFKRKKREQQPQKPVPFVNPYWQPFGTPAARYPFRLSFLNPI